MKKDFISVKDVTSQEISKIFGLTGKLKENKAGFSRMLAGKTLALIFQKPSNRTRVSFEVGMYQLGGYSIYLGPNEINLGVREAVGDVAKTLSRYVDGIVLRTFAHENVLEMARFSDKPVINGLSDLMHPCQALSDIYTIKEKLHTLKGLTLAYIGDGNNVCNSLLYASAKTGLNIQIAVPKGYEPDSLVLKEAKLEALRMGGSVKITHQPQEAVQGADVIYTDTWTSMGQEKESKARKKAFSGVQINKQLLKLSGKHPLIMHCLPAHRGEEITGDVLDSKNSIVFDQAENRMHVQKAILITLLSKK